MAYDIFADNGTYEYIKEASEQSYSRGKPPYRTYIDTINSFPSEMIGKNIEIYCTRLSVRENRNHSDLYNIDGVCQTEKDRGLFYKINPFSISFISSHKIAKQISSKNKDDFIMLSGRLIKDKDLVTLSNYIFVVNLIEPESVKSYSQSSCGSEGYYEQIIIEGKNTLERIRISLLLEATNRIAMGDLDSITSLNIGDDYVFDYFSPDVNGSYNKVLDENVESCNHCGCWDGTGDTYHFYHKEGVCTYNLKDGDFITKSCPILEESDSL